MRCSAPPRRMAICELLQTKVPYQLRSKAYASHPTKVNRWAMPDLLCAIITTIRSSQAMKMDGPLCIAKRVGESLTNHCLGTDEKAAENNAFGELVFGVPVQR